MLPLSWPITWVLIYRLFAANKGFIVRLFRRVFPRFSRVSAMSSLSTTTSVVITDQPQSRWQKLCSLLAHFFDRPWKLPLIVLLAVVTVGFPRLVGPILKNHYQIGLDLQDFKCLPHTLYLFRSGRVNVAPETGNKIRLEYGQYVSFIPYDNMMGRPELDGIRVVKIVAGLPGDRLEVKNDVAYINGKEWGGLTLLETLDAKKGSFDRTEVVPEGKVLLLGTTPYSYDGRYYGFIDQAVINTEAFPLF